MILHRFKKIRKRKNKFKLSPVSLSMLAFLSTSLYSIHMDE